MTVLQAAACPLGFGKVGRPAQSPKERGTSPYHEGRRMRQQATLDLPAQKLLRLLQKGLPSLLRLVDVDEVDCPGRRGLPAVLREHMAASPTLALKMSSVKSRKATPALATVPASPDHGHSWCSFAALTTPGSGPTLVAARIASSGSGGPR